MSDGYMRCQKACLMQQNKLVHAAVVFTQVIPAMCRGTIQQTLEFAEGPSRFLEVAVGQFTQTDM
jgi:hypothetical protein